MSDGTIRYNDVSLAMGSGLAMSATCNSTRMAPGHPTYPSWREGPIDMPVDCVRSGTYSLALEQRQQTPYPADQMGRHEQRQIRRAYTHNDDFTVERSHDLDTASTCSSHPAVDMILQTFAGSGFELPPQPSTKGPQFKNNLKGDYNWVMTKQLADKGLYSTAASKDAEELVAINKCYGKNVVPRIPSKYE